MTHTERPLNRKERRAAEHAARKAANKRAKAEAHASAAQPAPEETPAAIWTEAQIALIRAAEKEIYHLAAGATSNASIDPPPSEPLNLPIVEDYKGGPRTEAGKQISSQNAVKHGGCSVSILIHDNESMEDFLALEKRWLQTYNPDTAAEIDLVKAAVRAEWFYLRSERNFAQYEHQIACFNFLPSQWEDYVHKTYARFLRYRTANLNILNKSRKAIEDFRKNRQQETAKAQALNHAKEKLEIARSKFEIYQENHDVPLDQMLEGMRKKAERLGFRKPDTK